MSEAEEPQGTKPITQGDTVRLKSGGPLMTVQVCSSNLAYCLWFGEGAERKDSIFQIDALERIDGVSGS